MLEKCKSKFRILLKLEALGPYALKLNGPLVSNENFQYVKCQGLGPVIDKRDLESAVVDKDSIEVVDSFCYLGDIVCNGATIDHCRTAWEKLKNSRLCRQVKVYL